MSSRSPRVVRILPIVILLLMAILPVQIGIVVEAATRFAQAEEALDPAMTDQADSTQAPPAVEDNPKDVAPDHAAACAEDDTGAIDLMMLPRSEYDLLQKLMQRRADLDARETALRDREALLDAMQKKLTVQIDTANQLKAEMQALREKQESAGQGNIRRLVTVYEAMKPEDAARIFNGMEPSIVLDVMTRMSERRLAPVLAQMEPTKAQALTVALARRREPAVAAAGSE